MQDLFKYPSDFTGGNIQDFHMTFFMEGKKLQFEVTANFLYGQLLAKKSVRRLPASVNLLVHSMYWSAESSILSHSLLSIWRVHTHQNHQRLCEMSLPSSRNESKQTGDHFAI